MHNIIKTLNIHDIIETSDVDKENQSHNEQIFMFLIFNVIQKVHFTVVDFIFKNTNLLLWMLVVHAFFVYKMQYQQLKMIMKNEKIIAEIMQVHEKIFLKQLDFIVRVLLSEWIRDNKNNELNLNMSDILNFIRESAYIVQKS